MLYVVATPIGNLGDMSARAVDTLRRVALIAAEDTRVTMKLLNHFDISTPLTSCHRHNEAGKAALLVKRMLSEGIDIALVTDAGTPALSDPGTRLVRMASDAGIPVMAVAGPSALAAALSVSGVDAAEFLFIGFPPREKKALRECLLSAATRAQAAVLYESPHRVLDTLRVMRQALPGAYVSVSCDLTKLHELTLRGDIASVLAQMEANAKAEKGEYCVIADFRGVAPPSAMAAPAASLEARLLDHLLSGLTLREAARALEDAGERKNAVYAAMLRLKGLLREED